MSERQDRVRRRVADGPPSPACILAAHGSRRDRRAGAVVWRHVDRLRRQHGFSRVTAAFHQGFPSLAGVLDSIAPGPVSVIPFFSAEGYYSRVVLPRELSRSPRFPEMRLSWSRPVGTHSGIASLVETRARQVMERFALPPGETALVVIGHGTRRHPESGSSTSRLVARLETRQLAARVRAAFLDQDPSLEEVFGHLTLPRVLVVPFLIGGSHHVLRDLPRRTGVAIHPEARFPFRSRIGEREVVLDRALGEDPGITPLLAELAREAEGAGRPEGGR